MRRGRRLIPATILAAVVGLMLGPITATLADEPLAGSGPNVAGARRVSNVLQAVLAPADPDEEPGNGGPGGGGPGGGGPGGGGGSGGDIDVPPGEEPAAGPGEGQPIRPDADTVVTTADGWLTVIVPQGAAPAGSTLHVRRLAVGEQPLFG